MHAIFWPDARNIVNPFLWFSFCGSEAFFITASYIVRLFAFSGSSAGAFEDYACQKLCFVAEPEGLAGDKLLLPPTGSTYFK